MYKVARRTAANIKHALIATRERWQLASLYSPDPNDVDPHRHLEGAVDWLKRAQDAGSNRGISYGLRFGSDFEESYPETTGYICRTFVELSRRNSDPDLLNRAIEMGEWEADIQMPEGAVMGGQFNRSPTPAIFNTGMVLLGWSALIRANAGGMRIRTAATRASDWMAGIQELDGNWIRGNSKFAAPGAMLYNVKAAWGLCEAGAALGREDYIQAAVRNAEFCIQRQQPNGWFRDCCLSDPARPLLHTIAYTMEGLIGIGEVAGRNDFIEVAKKTADAELRIMQQDGFIPGRQDSEFGAAVDWCCLTGSAQTSVVWSKLYRLTGDKKYVEGIRRVNRYLMAHHDIRNPDPRLRGGLPGSWPVWGDYGRLTILNWATKFLVDALVLELDAQEQTGTAKTRR